MNAVDMSATAAATARRAAFAKWGKLALTSAVVLTVVWLFLTICSKIVVAVNAALGAGLFAYFINNVIVTLLGWLCAKAGVALASTFKARI